MASNTRQRLIESGFELFSREGFHAIGLDRVLDHAGVSKQTFYNHFESKDALVEEVLRYHDQWEMRSWDDVLRQRAGSDPCQRLYALFDVLHVWFNEPDFRGCLFMSAAAEFPSPHDPAHQIAAAHHRALRNSVRDLAERAGADEPDLLADQIALLMQGSVAVRHIAGDRDAARHAGRVARALLDRHLGSPALAAPAVARPFAVA